MINAGIEGDGRTVRRGARLRAYGLWQLRDYLMDRGAPTVIVLALFGYLTLAPVVARFRGGGDVLSPRSMAGPGAGEAARLAALHDVSAVFLANFLGVVCFLGALFAMNGIVGNDRKQGFYRFLFAKPVAPQAYYGQAFVLHWVGFLAVVTLLALLYGAFVVPVLSMSLFTVLALMFLCYAGIAFVLSAVARWDWLSLVSVTVAATYLWNRFGASEQPLAKLVYLLPPLHRTSEVYSAAAKGMALPWHSLAWLAGYGAVCFVIGLMVLRYRRLAII
jgi:hypothetical protein